MYKTVYGSEHDADVERSRLAVEIGRSPYMGRSETISDYWPVFMRRITAKGVSKATIKDYEKQWRLRIEPRFGGMRWGQLKFSDIQNWVLDMTHSQAEHSIRTLRRLINCAIDDELLDSNPLDHRRIDYPIERVDPLAVVEQTWGAHHVAEAMSRLRGDRIEALWLAMIGGGLRPEEALALWWSDISMTPVLHMDGTDGWMVRLSITKSWTEADGLHGTKNRFSTRLVPVPDPFATRLLELSVQGPRMPLWEWYPRTASRRWKSLFDEGGPLRGMPAVRLKDMRSIHETLMQEAGTLDTINARMHGRTNVQTGYTHYLHPSRSMEVAAEQMGKMFGNV